MEAARRVLLGCCKGDEWKEFAGASNLIGWRYRASVEDWLRYRDSWMRLGANVLHEEVYQRERALFGMFSSGVSCLESAVYAIAAFASHRNVLSIPFTATEQRACSPKKLLAWVAPVRGAASLAVVLRGICESNDWKLWIDLRNRMNHRSNLPRVTIGSVGSEPPPAKAIHFAATSSTPAVEGDLVIFDDLRVWLMGALTDLLTAGKSLSA